MFARVLRPALRRAVAVPPAAGFATRRAVAAARPTAHRAPSAWSSFVGLAVLLAAAGAPALAAGATTVEPATSISFDDSFNGVPLVGVGVRYKWGLVKVYAVGAYLENAQECAASGSGLFEGLLNSTGRKAIQIKMARAVDAKVLVDALEEAFTPRLALPGRSNKGMAAFREAVVAVTGDKVGNGDVVSFEVGANGSIAVHATMGGAAVKSSPAPFVDKDVAFALLDTYLGTAAPEVSPTLKDSIKKRLAA